MPGGFSNKPKILRGAFVEYKHSVPRLFVAFQFNPVQLARSRTLSYAAPGKEETRGLSLREFHGREAYQDLDQLQKDQQVDLQEETINFEIRLDATDKLSEGDPLAVQFGVAPQLATLELMVQPRDETHLDEALGKLLGQTDGFSFTKGDNPPLILFVWGTKRVLPVNITSLSITETEFNAALEPIRATVAVNLTVIEGPNPVYTHSGKLKGKAAAHHLAQVTDMDNVVIPE